MLITTFTFLIYSSLMTHTNQLSVVFLWITLSGFWITVLLAQGILTWRCKLSSSCSRSRHQRAGNFSFCVHLPESKSHIHANMLIAVIFFIGSKEASKFCNLNVNRKVLEEMEMLHAFTAVLHVPNLSKPEHLLSVLEESDVFSKQEVAAIARNIGGRRYVSKFVQLRHYIYKWKLATRHDGAGRKPCTYELNTYDNHTKSLRGGSHFFQWVQRLSFQWVSLINIEPWFRSPILR